MGDTYRVKVSGLRMDKETVKAKRHGSARFRRVRQTVPFFFFDRIIPTGVHSRGLAS